MSRTLPMASRGRRLRLGLAAASLAIWGAGAARADDTPKPNAVGPEPGAPLAATTWKDIAGRTYTAKDLAESKVTVFLFVSTQCPISNIYTPRIQELAKTYAPRHVAFFLVDSNRDDSLQTIRHYAQARAFTIPVIKDDGTTLADRLAADKTPEAILLDSGGIVRYRGRIDDNKDREKIIRHDVQDALDALLAGKAVLHPRTLAFGCSLFRDTVRLAGVITAKVTYTRDVAPILNARCVSCHRQGEAAPFALENYTQAHTWATPIKDYTARRVMPPWKAAPGYGDFHDARVLTETQIATLAKWADSGAAEGDPKDLPPAPKFAATTGWTLGTPDLILKTDRPYHLAAEGNDVYRQFVMPLEAKEDRYIDAIEFRPDNRAVVHHIIVFFDTSGEAVKLDGKEAEPGYTVPGTGIGVPQQKAIWVQGWAAGATPYVLPPGLAFRLPAGAKIVLQVHYHKDGRIEADQSQVGVHFVDKSKVDQDIRVAAVINPFFDLKPGVAHQEVKQSLTLPMDVHAWAVFPHMHMLGREMKLVATLPDGTRKPLIWINDWDFNWQETYRYKEPVALPKGTKVDLVAVFDNSEQNPRQMSHPPKEVFWGEQTTDEMCIGFFQFTVDAQHRAAKQ
jgi:thiol-disulfide isomerase/thioredoxin